MGLINKKQEYQDQKAWSDNVQKLKGYKEFVKKVEYWAEQKNSYRNPVIEGSYEIIWDEELGWCIDVDGSVSFNSLNIEYIPFQFRNVSGSFWCNKCKKITSLKGCPVHVGEWFDCSRCENLSSLEGCPRYVGHIFYCKKCYKKFTEENVQSLCNVKGEIHT